MYMLLSFLRTFIRRFDFRHGIFFAAVLQENPKSVKIAGQRISSEQDKIRLEVIDLLYLSWK